MNLKLKYVFLFFIFVCSGFAKDTVTKKDPVKKINTLIFYGKYEDLKKEYKKTGIIVNDVDIPDINLFKKEMSNFLSKPITTENLDEIKRKVISYYNKHSYYFVNAFILEDQDISSGKIKIFVLIGKLGELRVSGARHFSNSKIAEVFRTKPNQYVNSKVMIEDLIWINKNLFRSASAIYEPGKELGLTDVNVIVKDRVPIRVYSGYENTGNNIGGSSRLLTGINVGNCFNLAHELNFQVMSAPEIHKWWSVCGNYIAPFSRRCILKFLGAYVQTKPPIQPHYKLRGKSTFLGGRYHVLLPYFLGTEQEYSIGYDFKRMNNFLSIAGNTLYNRYIDISQFFLRYEALHNFPNGFSALQLSLYISPGHMTRYNKTIYFEQERPGVKSNYFYFTANFDRTHHISTATWFLRAMMQFSSGKLLPTEQMAIGGYNTVRGYQEYMLVGNKGCLLSNEIRTSQFKIYLKSRKNYSSLQFLSFLDYGWVTGVDKNILPKQNAYLLSVGPGLRFIIKENFNVRLDYGVQLKHIKGRQFEKSGHSRLHAQVMINF
jgi:hemolysin activation/secretion protein